MKTHLICPHCMKTIEFQVEVRVKKPFEYEINAVPNIVDFLKTIQLENDNLDLAYSEKRGTEK